MAENAGPPWVRSHTGTALAVSRPSLSGAAENTLHPTAEEVNWAVYRTSVACLVEAGLAGSGRAAVVE